MKSRAIGADSQAASSKLPSILISVLDRVAGMDFFSACAKEINCAQTKTKISQPDLDMRRMYGLEKFLLHFLGLLGN